MVHLPVDDSAELSLLEPRHAPVLYHLVDRNRQRLRAWLPWLDDCAGVDDAAAFIEEASQRTTTHQGLELGIFTGGTLAGLAGFTGIEESHRRGSLGYWLAGGFTGRGLATRCGRALVEAGFGRLELNRIEIRCSPRNAPSRAVALRLGFVLEGLLRQAEWLYDHFEDHEVYGMLAGDWSAAEGQRP